MDVARRVSELIAGAIEWRHARTCAVAVAAVGIAAGGAAWWSRKPANELVTIEEALAQSAPARVVLPANVKVPSDRSAPASGPSASTVEAASGAQKPPVPVAPSLQTEAIAVPASAMAAPAAWGVMLGAMRRDGAGGAAQASSRETAPRALPAMPTPTAGAAVAAATAAAPVVEPARTAPAVRRVRRHRIVRYVYVEPRRASYRRRAGDPMGDVARSVTRGVRTISRVLTSIAN